MEPVDYLKILKNHWKVVAALVVIAVVVVYWVSPREASQAYRAEHVLLLDVAPAESESTTALDNVDRAAFRLTSGELPLRAALLLEGVDPALVLADDAGGDDAEGGDPEGDDPEGDDAEGDDAEGDDAEGGDAEGDDGPDVDLGAVAEQARTFAERVTAVADRDVGTITITAADARPHEAVRIANAFGLAWIQFVEEEEAGRRDEAVAGAEARIDEIDERMVEIAAELRAGPPEAAASRLREEDDLRGERADLLEELRADDVAVSYITLSDATEATAEASLFSTRPQRMILAALVAAVLGFGVAIVFDRNDSRVRTKDEAEKAFGLPVLAEVPLLPLRDRGKAAVIAYEREPRLAEAYRSLRTALALVRGFDANGRVADTRASGEAGTRQVVVVTSPEPGEGKSSTTANLAMAYAEAGHSVLILSWDLWRPLSPVVFGAVDGPGVADYLADPDASLTTYIQDTSVPGVRMVTAGVRGGHPSPRPDAVGRLLEDARSMAGVVVVDTAPILSASVTRELATKADVALIVCRAARTTAEAAHRCAEMLDRVGAPALGVVMVGVATGAFADYYGPARKAGYDRVAGPRRRTVKEPAVERPGPTTAGGPGDGRHLRQPGAGAFRAGASGPSGTDQRTGREPAAPRSAGPVPAGSPAGKSSGRKSFGRKASAGKGRKG